MKHLAAIICAAALGGCASYLPQSAAVGIGADGAITAGAVLTGAASEGNPLVTSWPVGVASVLGRLALVAHYAKADEPQRTQALSSINAITWGVVANNIAAVLWHSNPASLTIGAVAGWLVWSGTEEERLFAQVCAAERVKNPALRCEYRRAS